jgi:DNA invertase Pin-like site-specific DNA recombinase
VSTRPPIAAAQYLRMSTEHQLYSFENQSAAIKGYADTHGFCVLQTYSDAARSGLVLRNRAGLRQLLQDVVGNPTYKAILVYDVSRWGRFLDADESAHYEFICKSAGVPVHYCAESFANDGSFPSAIMKSLKRVMAGEFSRELSVKVYEGSKRISQLGFKTGGIAGYGLRRMLVSGGRQHKLELACGQLKNIKDDRVILVPGPAEEVNCIREIFQMYAEEHKLPITIARELNRRGIKYAGVKRTEWNSGVISRILDNPKYVGCNVYGKRSQKLRTRTIAVPRALWVITPGAWTPVVSQGLFDKAQRRARNQTFFKSDEQVLTQLRGLLASEGVLSEKLIEASPGFPSMQAYRRRFGSLTEAFARIECGGAQLDKTLTRRKRSAMREELMRRIVTAAGNEVSVIRRDKHCRPTLELPNKTLVSVHVCPSFKVKSGELRWLLNRAYRKPDHITLLARLNGANDDFQDFHIISKSRTRAPWTITLGDGWLKNGEPVPSMADFRDVVQHMQSRQLASCMQEAGD